jgi:hypothetical protein
MSNAETNAETVIEYKAVIGWILWPRSIWRQGSPTRELKELRKLYPKYRWRTRRRTSRVEDDSPSFLYPNQLPKKP